MRYQKLSSWCGPASVQNALRALGLDTEQETLAFLCRADEDGCDEQDLLHGLSRLSVQYGELELYNDHEALRALKACLIIGRPVVICVEDFEHWCCAIGVLGDSFIVIDPSNEYDNKDQNGVQVLSPEELLAKWKASYTVAGEEAPYYGIWISQ